MAAEEPKAFGAYLLLKALGRGAMGDVWLSRPLNKHRGIPTPIVVKRLHGELATRKGFVARFRHEAAVAVSVDSPHVAKVYDVGAVGDTLYISMEYVPGWPLSKVLDAILKSGRHASIASVVDLIAGGLEGLDKLHSAKDAKTNKPLGIVHRDISPKNLMVGEDGRMRLIDLGLGKSNVQDWKTRTGVVMGSVGYMPPEQARGERVDSRADVYSMAVVCFEMLALRNYVKRGTLAAMMEASAKPSFMKPSEFRPDVPDGLDEVLSRALNPDREERYKTARHFLDALRRIVPPSHTEGGMVALLSELFGATRQEREEEVFQLLALPAPDEPEGEPTRVFVSRAGVMPPDQQPTQYGAPDEPSMLATQARPDSRRTPEPEVVPTRHTPQSSPAAVNEPSSTIPPSGSQVSSQMAFPPNGVSPFMGAASSSGVSIPVLVLSILLASTIGAIVALFAANILVINWGTEPAEIAEMPPPATPVVPEVKVREAPPEPPSPTAIVARPTKILPKRRLPAKRTKRRLKDEIVSAPPATPPPEKAKSLNLELQELKAELATLQKEVGDSDRMQVRKLILETGKWLKAKDSPQKKAWAETVRRQIKTLRGS